MTRIKESATKIARRFRTRLGVAFATTAVALGLLGGSLAVTAPAMAGGCNAGTWGGVNGWGDCRGIGKRKWQLKVSCTWASSATSSVLTGDGHVDVRCPWPTSANYASIIYR
jgi:hypothetical protein